MFSLDDVTEVVGDTENNNYMAISEVTFGRALQ